MFMKHTCTLLLIYVNMWTTIASIGSGLLNNFANKENSKEAFEAQKDYSTWLLRNQTQERVKDLRSAGLNPAFMNGSQLGSSVPPSSYTPSVSQNPFDLGTAMMFGKTSADTRLTNAQAKAQELLNADKESKNKVLAHQYDSSVWMLDGQPISDDEAMRIMNSGSFDDVHQIPEFSIIPAVSDGAEGRFNAEQALKRWNKESSDIDVGMLHNQLETMVTQGQISNPRVIQALQNMPYRQYKELVERISNLVTQRDNMKKQGAILDIERVTMQLEQDIQRDNNINQYIEKIFSGDFEIKDLCKVLVMAFLGCVSNFGGNMFRKPAQTNITNNR